MAKLECIRWAAVIAFTASSLVMFATLAFQSMRGPKWTEESAIGIAILLAVWALVVKP